MGRIMASRNASPGDLSGSSRPTGQHSIRKDRKSYRKPPTRRRCRKARAENREPVGKRILHPRFTFLRVQPKRRRHTQPQSNNLPAVADWDGTFNLARGGEMKNRWASQEFSTDWGARDLSPTVPFYDPISYHQGSVWPLFTGWGALSEYRSGRSLPGYTHLMQNA